MTEGALAVVLALTLLAGVSEWAQWVATVAAVVGAGSVGRALLDPSRG